MGETIQVPETLTAWVVNIDFLTADNLVIWFLVLVTQHEDHDLHNFAICLNTPFHSCGSGILCVVLDPEKKF